MMRRVDNCKGTPNQQLPTCEKQQQDRWQHEHRRANDKKRVGPRTQNPVLLQWCDG